MKADAIQGARLSVLLVEDNPADAHYARMALTSVWGPRLEVSEAATLGDAHRALEGGAFDVVLLDLGLPDSLGLSTFSVLHARFRHVPVVILSAMADEATTLHAVRLGAQDYVIKGRFDEALLARVVRHAMERHHLVVQLERSLAYVRSLLRESGHAAPTARPEASAAICAWCKKLRAPTGSWETIEEYLAKSSDARLTEETCPECVAQIRRAWGSEGAR